MREIRADMKKNILISVVVIASLGLLSCTTGITFLFYATTPLVSVIDICIDFYQGQGLDMDMNEILKQWYQNTGVRIEEAYTPECTWFSLAEATLDFLIFIRCFTDASVLTAHWKTVNTKQHSVNRLLTGKQGAEKRYEQANWSQNQ